ncbi:hypothetical protein K8I61_12590 [bacterium]|nr:hypothetical protein [bacterium]
MPRDMNGAETKICASCLTLFTAGDTCPACGRGLVPLGMWRRMRGEPIETEPASARDSADADNTAAATGAIDGADRSRFVLGIFLASLAFFIAFLAAYIVTEL